MDMAKAVPGIDVKTYPGAPEYLRDLASGRLDAALNDRLMLAYLMKNSQLPLRTGANVGAGNPSGIPFKKGNPKFAEGHRRRDDPARSGRHVHEDLGQVVRHRRQQADQVTRAGSTKGGIVMRCRPSLLC